MLTRPITFAVAVAAVTLSTITPAEACRPITLTVQKTEISDGWMQFKSFFEVQGKRFATNWKRDDKDEFKDCNRDGTYCYWVLRALEDRDLSVGLLFNGLYYEYGTSNKRVGEDHYEYYHCVE
ncbi:hypothetical protein BGZ82_001156 [Podila clonocystis]|nr:hypothetical protein BGZ82_001156 [Podila clonocystis]